MATAKLTESLRRAGFTAYESEAYIALLKARELTAEDISRTTKIPITRVYGTLEQLMQKGFARIVQSRPKRYHAVPPNQAKQEYLVSLRRSFESNLLSLEEIMYTLQKEVEPLYVEGHLQVKAEELLEPLENLQVMERRTSEQLQRADKEVLISTALFSWFPKIRERLRDALDRDVKVRILMQFNQSQMRRNLSELNKAGAQIRDTRDPWHPVRGTLIDNKELVFVIWAAEETERHWNPIVYIPHYTRNPGFIRIFRESFDFRWGSAKRITTRSRAS
jgi:sugar-specific transcriptional regulator TrmB